MKTYIGYLIVMCNLLLCSCQQTTSNPRFYDEGVSQELAILRKQEYQEAWERNRKLIDLFWFVGNIPLDKIPLKRKKTFNYDKFRKLCIEYSLASFLTKEFIKPFKKLSE